MFEISWPFLVYVINDLTVESYWSAVLGVVLCIVPLLIGALTVPDNIPSLRKKYVLKDSVMLGNSGELPAGTEYMVFDYRRESECTHARAEIRAKTEDGKYESFKVTTNVSEFLRELYANSVDAQISESPRVGLFYPMWLRILIILVFTYQFLMPRAETARYMAGAYILQTIATNETTKELGSKFVGVLVAQLDIWAKETPKLKELVGENLSDVKNTVQVETQKLVNSVNSIALTTNDAISAAISNSTKK